MVSCSACGAQLQSSDRFCGECGQKIEAAAVMRSADPIAPDSEKNRSGLWIGGAGLIIVLILSIPFFWHGSSPQQSATPIRPAAQNVQPTSRIVTGPGFLGVEVSTQGPTESETSSLRIPSGAYVVSVVPGSPAEKAGLRVRDLIYSINAQPISSKEELVSTISAAGANTKVRINYYRESGYGSVEVMLGIRLN